MTSSERGSFEYAVGAGERENLGNQLSPPFLSKKVAH